METLKRCVKLLSLIFILNCFSLVSFLFLWLLQKIVAALHRKVLFSSFYLLWTLLRILSSNPKVKTPITDGNFDSESKMVGKQIENETCVLGFLKELVARNCFITE